MQLLIEGILSDFERGRLTRRQVVASLAALVTGAQAAPNPSGLHAVSLNHVTVRVPDVQRTSQFYQEFFGMPVWSKYPIRMKSKDQVPLTGA